MQPISVAVSDDNLTRRAILERLLHSEPGIKILTNVKSKNNMWSERRHMPRETLTAVEDNVARIRRLKPRVLFANMDQCINDDFAMLVSLRRECPQTLVILLADDSNYPNEKVMQALAIGARGFLDVKAYRFNLNLPKAVHVVDRGEAWVPRKMLGKIMGMISPWLEASSTGGLSDSAC